MEQPVHAYLVLQLDLSLEFYLSVELVGNESNVPPILEVDLKEI